VAVSEKGKEGVAVVVTLPQEFKDDDIAVRCFGDNHNSEFTLRGDGTTKRTAQYVLPSSPHNVEVTCNGLVIYSGHFDAVGLDANITISVSLSSERADEQDNQGFVITFRNKGKQNASFPVSVSGNNISFKKTTVTVRAGQSARVTGSFTKVITRESRRITITYGDNETVTRTLTVVPIVEL
jgi:hypothetical protein